MGQAEIAGRRAAMHLNHGAMIRQFGRSIQGVFPRVGQDGVAFAYSIGNCESGRPELLVMGMAGQTTMALINTVSELLKPEQFVEGQIDIDWNLPFWLKERTDKRVREEYTIQVGQVVGHEDYRIMQIVYPDKGGRFYWEAGADPAIWNRQKLFFD